MNGDSVTHRVFTTDVFRVAERLCRSPSCLRCQYALLVLQLLHPASSEQCPSTDHTSSLQEHVASGKEIITAKQQVADTSASLAVAKPAGCDAADQAVSMRCSNDSMPHGDVGLIAEAHSSDLQQRNQPTDNTVHIHDPELQHQQLAASAEGLQQLPQESCRNTCAVFPAALLGCYSDLIPMLSQSSGLVNLMQFRWMPTGQVELREGLEQHSLLWERFLQEAQLIQANSKYGCTCRYLIGTPAQQNATAVGAASSSWHCKSICSTGTSAVPCTMEASGSNSDSRSSSRGSNSNSSSSTGCGPADMQDLVTRLRLQEQDLADRLELVLCQPPDNTTAALATAAVEGAEPDSAGLGPNTGATGGCAPRVTVAAVAADVESLSAGTATNDLFQDCNSSGGIDTTGDPYITCGEVQNHTAVDDHEQQLQLLHEELHNVRTRLSRLQHARQRYFIAGAQQLLLAVLHCCFSTYLAPDLAQTDTGTGRPESRLPTAADSSSGVRLQAPGAPGESARVSAAGWGTPAALSTDAAQPAAAGPSTNTPQPLAAAAPTAAESGTTLGPVDAGVQVDVDTGELQPQQQQHQRLGASVEQQHQGWASRRRRHQQHCQHEQGCQQQSQEQQGQQQSINGQHGQGQQQAEASSQQQNCQASNHQHKGSIQQKHLQDASHNRSSSWSSSRTSLLQDRLLTAASKQQQEAVAVQNSPAVAGEGHQASSAGCSCNCASEVLQLQEERQLLQQQLRDAVLQLNHQTEQHEQELLSLFELQEQHSQQIFADIEQAHAARLASLSADLEASRAELAATKRQLALRSGDAADLASMSAVELAELAGLVEKGLAKIREAKVRTEAEQERCCPVCWARAKEVVFGCGHQACGVCSDRLQACPICRRAISIRIKLY